MDQQDGEGVPESIAGLPLEDAVDAVVAENDDRDPESVRSTLQEVTEDGVVCQAGVDDALATVSKVVSTPETRLELAESALADAQEAAEPVTDLAVVRERLSRFETRQARIEGEVSALGETLQELVDRSDDPDDLYALAGEIQRLTGTANDLQQAADDLTLDLESFERWLGNPDVRVREFADDVDALEEFHDNVAAAVGEIADAETTDDPPTGGADHEEIGRAWIDALLCHRVLALLITDLRDELADLRTWADREGIGDGERAADLESRIDDVEEAITETGERLENLARSEWENQYHDRLKTFEETLETFEPPVDWRAVRAELDTHRKEIEDARD